ncbi:hypothetical protein MO867_00905 [Microbulbifer sp. OS29]|uniref:Uncharacterized protein n=1 Tax=Microbulbifer okhotskensis TaxID=2926617 RepID=A0A9X2EKV3_9GAMM|nr:hypothetical protein [Microbulbifer okhotskensis]MCO1332885.1 hypothetical protein [Microbulbifer okhotskensis]
MSHVYVLTNQHQQFLSKSGEWTDGREPNKLFRNEHKDIAINQMFEANTRDVSLRIELLQCDLSTKGQPLIPEEAFAQSPVDDIQGTPEAEPSTPEELPEQDDPDLDPAPQVAPEETPEVASEQATTETSAQPDEKKSESAA